MANLRALAAAAARQYGIPVDIFLRQIQQESGFNPNARSPAGALGVAQFMPATARGAGVNPLNPQSALYGAARMDAQNLHKYGNWKDVLSLYNSGRGWSQGRNIGETRNYVSSILGGRSPGGSPGVAQALLAASPSAQAPAGPNLSGLRSQLAQSLIAASQATAEHKTPDYTQTFALVAALKSPSAPNAAPIPVFAASSVPQQKARQAVQLAQHFLGTSYRWGGSSPKTGFDCSGLLQYVWSQQGVRIPRTSQQQWKSGRPVPLTQLRAGDAVFFEGGAGGPGHVGMMIDRSHFIEAPHTGAVVRISSIQGRGAIGARRFA